MSDWVTGSGDADPFRTAALLHFLELGWDDDAAGAIAWALHPLQGELSNRRLDKAIRKASRKHARASRNLDQAGQVAAALEALCTYQKLVDSSGEHADDAWVHANEWKFRGEKGVAWLEAQAADRSREVER